MCYRAGAFISPDAACDREQLRLLGWLGEDSPHVLGIVDPLDEDDLSTGVEVRQHPAALVARDPDVWRVIDEWDTGVRRKPRAGDSHWRTVAIMHMRAAHARERRREMKRASKKGAE